MSMMHNLIGDMDLNRIRFLNKGQKLVLKIRPTREVHMGGAHMVGPTTSGRSIILGKSNAHDKPIGKRIYMGQQLGHDLKYQLLILQLKLQKGSCKSRY